MNRRTFVGHLGRGAAAVALVGTLEIEGCSVFNDIVNWIPVGQAALQGVISILESGGYVSQAAAAIVVTINAAFTQLLADIKAYQAINPPPAGALARIEAGLGILVTNFQAFLSAINIPNSPLLTTVVALVQIILSTIAGFENKLPTAVKTTLAAGTFRMNGQYYQFTAQHRTRRKFKRDYNATAKAGGHPEIEIPMTFWEHI